MTGEKKAQLLHDCSNKLMIIQGLSRTLKPYLPDAAMQDYKDLQDSIAKLFDNIRELKDI